MGGWKYGIYRWRNLVNGLTYIGSAVDLTKRFNLYYNFKYLTKTKLVICRALNKYIHSKKSFRFFGNPWILWTIGCYIDRTILFKFVKAPSIIS